MLKFILNIVQFWHYTHDYRTVATLLGASMEALGLTGH
jgi:hypothetical protein